MPKRTKQKRATPALTPPSPALREYLRTIGRKGGHTSGARRMTNLTPKQRSSIARKAALARWNAAKKTTP
jgi:hypothetical protein